MTVFLGYGGIPSDEVNYPIEDDVVINKVYGNLDQHLGSHVPVVAEAPAGIILVPVPEAPTNVTGSPTFPDSPQGVEDV